MVSAILDTTFMLCSTIKMVRLAPTFLISCVTRSTSSWPHALCRLVQQHQLRVHRQRGGDLQRTLAAIRQLHRRQVGHIAQIDLVKQTIAWSLS